VSKLPAISGRACVAALERAGFSIKRQHGSHSGAMIRSAKLLPDHRVLDRGTLRGILRQAGLGIDQFNKLL
jgi:predicted RNA binding protein YcfA (HicA-like mRNA interferase family)